ncbi:MAG: hypothetical protein NC122_06495 [Faecalibacterium sp.]|nr:hypothetical protein [Ruminococcus sp.]MCM1392869.1 hypothetical protein [Ruminococcus sp.]MCM1485841.1 hypothetical protein [Faecalibacterium sp.]
MDNQPKIPTISNTQLYIVIAVSVVIGILTGVFIGIVFGLLVFILSLIIGAVIARHNSQMDEIHEIHLKLYELQTQLEEIKKNSAENSSDDITVE